MLMWRGKVKTKTTPPKPKVFIHSNELWTDNQPLWDVGIVMESSRWTWGQVNDHHATAWSHGMPTADTAIAGLSSLPIPISQIRYS